MTDDLITWLRAQMDEDEEVARDAGSGRWVAVDLAFVDDSEGHQVVRDEYMGAGAQAHIARHGPARALAEVEAKRRILAEYERYASERRRAMNGWDPEARNPSPIVRFLAALPYADQPGYREEWRP